MVRANKPSEIEFREFLEKANIKVLNKKSIHKRFLELKEDKQRYYEVCASKDGKDDSNEIFLCGDIMLVYTKLCGEQPDEDAEITYYNYRASKSFLFFKKVLEIFSIKLKKPNSVFVEFFKLMDAPSYRYKRLQCSKCSSRKIVCAGFTRIKTQRYKCSKCGTYVQRELNPAFTKNNTMKCPQKQCGSESVIKFGSSASYKQRYRCLTCKKTFSKFLGK